MQIKFRKDTALSIPCIIQLSEDTFLHVLEVYVLVKLGLDVTKPVFGVSRKTRFKPVSSASESSLKIEISPLVSLYMIHSKKQITKVLISLRGCAGWSVPLLFANPRRQVFSRRGPTNPYILS